MDIFKDRDKRHKEEVAKWEEAFPKAYEENKEEIEYGEALIARLREKWENEKDNGK
jgi:hypothetical protein